MKPPLAGHDRRLCNASLMRLQRQNGRTETIFTFATRASLLRLPLVRLAFQNEIESLRHEELRDRQVVAAQARRRFELLAILVDFLNRRLEEDAAVFFRFV